MRFLLSYILLFTLLGKVDAQNTGTRFNVGASVGINRQFLYTFNHSEYGLGEYIQGIGDFGFTTSVSTSAAIDSKNSLYIIPRFSYNKSRALLTQNIADYAQVDHSWRVKQKTFSAVIGIIHVFPTNSNKNFFIRAGVVNNIESRDIQFEKTDFLFSSNKYNNIYTFVNHTPSNKTQWILGSDLGAGIRLYSGVDLGINYTYNFTKSKVLLYTSELGSEQGASDVRFTKGELRARNNFISTELTIWFN